MQNTLVELIVDFIYATSLVDGHGLDIESIPDDIRPEFRRYATRYDAHSIPHYVRVLFRHYCLNNGAPRLDGIEQLRGSMSPKLSKLILSPKKKENGDISYVVSPEKKQLLFPNHFEMDALERQVSSSPEIVNAFRVVVTEEF